LYLWILFEACAYLIRDWFTDFYVLQTRRNSCFRFFRLKLDLALGRRLLELRLAVLLFQASWLKREVFYVFSLPV
jgi:hypothetical protein